jgi:NADH dehydrogenase
LTKTTNFFPPLLYQVATGFLDPSNISYPFRKLFKKYPNFHFHMGELIEIRETENKIVLTTGELSYNKLVIATGTQTNFFGNDNIRTAALPMKNIGDAILIKNTILERLEMASRTKDDTERKILTTIVIAGGGPTGVEIAGMLSELKRNIIPGEYPELRNISIDIYLVDGGARLLAPMSAHAQQYTFGALSDMGIILRLGTLVKDFIGDSVTFTDGSEIIAKTLIWSAGVTGSTINGLKPECFGRGHRILVDEYNKVFGTESIFAIGDTALQVSDSGFPGGHPQLAQVAIQQGVKLAKNILADEQGRTLSPFRYHDKGSMAIIGRNKAVADLPKPSLHFKGFLAWLMWLFVHLISLVNYRNKLRTFSSWIVAYLSKDQYLRMIFTPSVLEDHSKGFLNESSKKNI